MLDPEIGALVAAQEALPGPPAHEIPIADARAAHDRETEVLSGPGPAVAEVRDVHAPGPRGPVRIRVMRPAGDGLLPLVAYVHGGGWAIGTVEAFEPVCRALAVASGAVVTSVDYRLAPEHPFPAGLEDVCAAVRWLHDHATELGADPARMGIAGDSAGGNLAAVATRRLRDEGGPPLRHQALIYPVCDAALDTRSYREKGTGFGLSRESMRRFWDLYLDGADAADPDVSPLRAADLTGLPPAFVLLVPDDVLCDEGDAYARRLEAAGVPVTLRRYDGAAHGFFRWIAKAELARRAVDDVAAAVRAALA